MTAAPVHMAGERLMLDPAGAAFWPAQAALIVADLHFEKGSAAAAKGRLLPPWDTHATLDRLAALLRRYRPKTVVALGDSFHDTGGAGRMQKADAERLAVMAKERDFIWVSGNHDPCPPEGFAGLCVAEWRCGNLLFRHQAMPGKVSAEICGHHHPKAQVPVRGAVVTRPCFVFNGTRLMLPALGAYTGGLDVRDPAIGGLFPRGGRVFLLGGDRLFSFALPGGAAGGKLRKQALLF